MISLADLRARNIAPTWQEAVAVVQELLHTVVAQGSVERMPDLPHIALIANGDVVALPGGTSSAHPVCHMADLLKTLLDGSAAPPELEAFIKANLLYPPQFDTIEEFSMQLAFFERPGRRSDVEQLVSRAMTTDAQTRADEELKRLKEKAAESAEASAQNPQPSATPWYASRAALVGAGVLLALMIIATGALWFGRGPASNDASSEVNAPSNEPAAGTGAETTGTASGEQAVATASGGSSPAKVEQSLIDRTKSSLSRAVDYAFGSKDKAQGPAPAPAATANQTRSTASPAKAPRTGRPATAARNSSRNQPAASPSLASPGLRRVEPPQVSSVVTTPPVTGEPPMSVATSTELRTIVYSVGDPEVIPAMLLRPLLPEFPPPDVPPSQIGTLELVVDEHGDVERVRLVSPSNRFHERMLVAHAKTWKFRPAIRGGRPVKFRTVVRLTI
jgi:hypothetical protein